MTEEKEDWRVWEERLRSLRCEFKDENTTNERKAEILAYLREHSEEQKRVNEMILLERDGNYLKKEKIDFIKSKICDILELIIGTVVAIVIAIIVITSIFFLINGEIGLFATGIFLAASIAGLIIGWIEEMSGPVFWTVFVIQWASFFLMKILP